MHHGISQRPEGVYTPQTSVCTRMYRTPNKTVCAVHTQAQNSTYTRTTYATQVHSLHSKRACTTDRTQGKQHSCARIHTYYVPNMSFSTTHVTHFAKMIHTMYRQKHTLPVRKKMMVLYGSKTNGRADEKQKKKKNIPLNGRAALAFTSCFSAFQCILGFCYACFSFFSVYAAAILTLS